MLIKVCGMRNAENVKDVCSLGVNFIGLIFYEKSPRYVEANGINPTDTESIKNASAKRVGVFVNADISYIESRIKQYNLNCVQLHGNESADFCRQLRQSPEMDGKMILKAINISDINDIEKCTDYDNLIDMFVFDTKSKMGGGSGQQFDWNVLDCYNGNIPYLLSGGISPEDAWRVSAFVKSHNQCAGIDLNSRFETSPALKNINTLQQFIKELKNE